ncbi:unnamed protein product [Trichogramma brassicae]|uniref:Uncharacterized protein n=1 Tax=Trichogramma brassicae TaxID=86971 RepID=A0A6H5IJ41_9HYME|nr:unnamed protein product [Trichogramma brassicae]
MKYPYNLHPMYKTLRGPKTTSSTAGRAHCHRCWSRRFGNRRCITAASAGSIGTARTTTTITTTGAGAEGGGAAARGARTVQLALDEARDRYGQESYAIFCWLTCGAS